MFFVRSEQRTGPDSRGSVMNFNPAEGTMGSMATIDVPRRSFRDRLTQVAEAATHPLVPADFLDLFHPLRAGADLRARIVSVRHETKDAATIVLKPGADWRGHVPGQYIRIGVDVDGVRQWRAYS